MGGRRRNHKGTGRLVLMIIITSKYPKVYGGYM